MHTLSLGLGLGLSHLSFTSPSTSLSLINTQPLSISLTPKCTRPLHLSPSLTLHTLALFTSLPLSLICTHTLPPSLLTHTQLFCLVCVILSSTSLSHALPPPHSIPDRCCTHPPSLPSSPLFSPLPLSPTPHRCISVWQC